MQLFPATHLFTQWHYKYRMMCYTQPVFLVSYVIRIWWFTYRNVSTSGVNDNLKKTLPTRCALELEFLHTSLVCVSILFTVCVYTGSTKTSMCLVLTTLLLL